ncbi:MAG: DNA-processing protein DprA [Granulosicoccaceae bacterium]
MDEYICHLNAWLSFTLSPKINAPVRRQLYAQFADPHTLIEAVLAGALPQSIEQQRQSVVTRQRIDQALDWQTAGPDRHLLTLSDSRYPPLLASISSPPPVLYVHGKLEALVAPHVAMVGSRKATAPALDIARELASGLAAAGIAVVSGMALGVDAAAHQGCLNAGGRTIAVAATPPNVIYPRRHQHLAQAITENGAVVTEFPLGTPLRAGCFPQRNRIISGLSLGTIVVEAALPSGTLLTAKHAAEQDREVMVVPGSIRNPLVRGCHSLIKDGALLIESADDVLRGLSLPLSGHLSEEIPAAIRTETIISDPDALLLLENLGYDPASADVLSSKTGLSAALVTRALGKLELQGVICRSAGRYSRC